MRCRYRPSTALNLQTINPFLTDNGAAVDCTQAHADYDLCYNHISLFSGWCCMPGRRV